jgi:hypothetical protein
LSPFLPTTLPCSATPQLRRQRQQGQLQPEPTIALYNFDAAGQL